MVLSRLAVKPSSTVACTIPSAVNAARTLTDGTNTASGLAGTPRRGGRSSRSEGGRFRVGRSDDTYLAQDTGPATAFLPPAVKRRSHAIKRPPSTARGRRRRRQDFRRPAASASQRRWNIWEHGSPSVTAGHDGGSASGHRDGRSGSPLRRMCDDLPTMRPPRTGLRSGHAPVDAPGAPDCQVEAREMRPAVVPVVGRG